MRLCHVTLQSGHWRWSERSEIDPQILAQLITVVRECDQYGRADIPTPSGLLELRRLAPPNPTRHAAVWAIREPDGLALLTLAIAMKVRAGAGVWRTLHAVDEPGVVRATTAEDWPPAPWLAASMHLPLLLRPDIASWIGDLERCIGWAWIAGVYEQQ